MTAEAPRELDPAGAAIAAPLWISRAVSRDYSADELSGRNVFVSAATSAIALTSDTHAAPDPGLAPAAP